MKRCTVVVILMLVLLSAGTSYAFSPHDPCSCEKTMHGGEEIYLLYCNQDNKLVCSDPKHGDSSDSPLYELYRCAPFSGEVVYISESEGPLNCNLVEKHFCEKFCYQE